MLRLAVLLLLLANAGFFAWSQGLLLPMGLGPASPSEPQRLQQQLRPNDIRIIGVGAAPATGNGVVTARHVRSGPASRSQPERAT